MTLADQRPFHRHDVPWKPDTSGLTLEAVLQNKTRPPFSFREFAAYLEETYCSENLTFYLAVNDYNDMVHLYFGSVPDRLSDTVCLSSGELFDFNYQRPVALTEQEQHQMQKLQHKFNHILDRFIRTNATQEVNIPYELRAQLLEISAVSFHPAALKPAQVAVVELLRISAFIPFATHPDRQPPRPTRTKSASSRFLQSVVPHAADATHAPPLPNDAGFLKRLTSSLRFRGRSQSPPRMQTWRQISMAHPQPPLPSKDQPSKEKENTFHSACPTDMERVLSDESLTSTDSTTSSKHFYS